MSERCAGSEATVREPVVAGLFYPEEPLELRQLVSRFLNEAPRLAFDAPIRGIVSPHAGYMYSGMVAGHGFAQVQGREYSHVILIGPSHFEYFRGACVFDGQAYRTPLGTVAVDRELAGRIAAGGSRISLGQAGHHLTETGEGEHSLEVVLPFLQVALGECLLVPIVMAHQNWETCQELAEAIARVANSKSVLLVASSDLSHYHTDEQARSMDRKLIACFEKMEPEELLRGVVLHQMEACGAGPIATVVQACKLLGCTHARSVCYATSGDVPGGDRTRVVGYMAGVLW
ncbi:MAG: AmmeMemoRadiSam system protein B [Calditrichaeota bacterium]|nr:MAG: AmmeMemoRadiSam system protein B [Calditrichota bacterium]